MKSSQAAKTIIVLWQVIELELKSRLHLRSALQDLVISASIHKTLLVSFGNIYKVMVRPGKALNVRSFHSQLQHPRPGADFRTKLRAINAM